MARAIVPVPGAAEDASVREFDALRPEVADRDLRLLLERHHPPTGQDPVGGDVGVPGRMGTDVVAGPEEIADRTPDGPLAIEGNFDDRRSQGLGQIVGLQLELESTNSLLALDGERAGLAWGDAAFELGFVQAIETQGSALAQRRVRPPDGALGSLQDFVRERLDLRPGFVGAVVDLVVEGFALPRAFVHQHIGLIGDLAALGVGDRQVEIVSAMAVGGLRRDALRKGLGSQDAPADQIGERSRDGGFRLPIEIDAHRSVAELAPAGTVPRGPEPHDGAGTVDVHQHVLGTSGVLLDADEVAAIHVGPPGGRAGLGGVAIVAAGLLAGVSGVGQAGDCVAIDHLFQERLQRDRAGPESGGLA